MMQYDDEYLNWKSWDVSNFGDLDVDARNYFVAELRRAKVDLRSQMQVLEIGFGSGQFMGFCKSLSWRVTGVEANPKLVQAAKSRGFDACCATEVAELTNDSYDLIVAFDVFEHLDDIALGELLKQLHLLLKRGGKLLARFPNGDSPFSMPLQNGDASHRNVIGSQKAQYHFVSAGFKDIQFFPDAQPIRGSRGFLRLHRIIVVPLKAVLNLLVRLVFYPRTRIFFLASNLCFVAKKVKSD